MPKAWNHQGIIEKFEAHKNAELAEQMAAYLKNQFPFLGIQSPLRKQLLKEQFTEYSLPKPEALFEEAWKLYNLSEREYQYAAIALLEKMKKVLTFDDLSTLQEMIETKSWWDSVDSIAPTLVGFLVKSDRPRGQQTMLEWSRSGNMWTNRSAILHQLKFKQETDTDLLGKIITDHSSSKEFFIQKAIGWALREYAKTNPEFVHMFVASTELKPLSKREALKHFN
ncbi:DNA alkylation repair protein [Planococcus sp. N028]|uniref:DNA alkylation repair protein n=1 Tax=Planococcus shixiaomingii TaxID=3058393 RepID=A0ABT8N6R7_9BACL|nr:DNA alkylation repair protein [Planococcus sp. N028]MDN7243584.1 DNA alkylation repair protein [Planococcus sp. N028]